MKRMCTRIFFLLLTGITGFLLSASAQSKKPIPERLITLEVYNQPAGQVLEIVARQGGFEFSYNPATIDVQKRITLHCTHCTVREVLQSVFAGTVTFREKGNYLILHRSQPAANRSGTAVNTVKHIVFSGYVRDEATEILPWVTVYDKASLEATLSNEYGYFRIQFQKDQLPATLYFSKNGYRDTSFYIHENADPYFSVILQKRQKNVEPEPVMQAAASPAIFEVLATPPVSQNIADTLHRKWQVSFVPFAGTNGMLSGSVINDYSFNVLGGYSMGTTKAEFSGFLNLNRSDVSFLQFAGFANITGGNVRGVQLAGFSNTVRSDVNGFQFAGFMNTGFGNHTGGAFAGFLNFTAKNVSGVQASGFANLAGGELKGVQAAGVANITRKRVEGVQVSALVNFTPDTLKGTQIGFINAARHVDGTQVGFFNLAQSTSGIPVGFLSYVHNGYHKIEVSADEVFNTNIAFRTGVKAFHNIIQSGVNVSNDSLLLWHFGYGAGTTLDLSKMVALDFDLTASQMVHGDRNEKINLLTKAYLGTDVALSKHLSVCLGLTLNARIFKTNYSKYPDLFTWYEPNIFYDHTWELDRTRMQMWLGAKLGLRFL